MKLDPFRAQGHVDGVGELAERNLRPDFVASAAYMNRGSLTLMWSAGVGITVPLWAGQKQRPLIAEARSSFDAASASFFMKSGKRPGFTSYLKIASTAMGAAIKRRGRQERGPTVQ